MSAWHNGIESSLRASSLFGVLEADAVRYLAPHVARRRLERGECLWHAGEEASGMALIGSGLAKLVQPGGAILAIFGPHETLGQLALVGESVHSADALAATRILDVLYVDAVAIRTVSQSNLEFAHAMARSLAFHSRALLEKIRIMSAGCVEQRLATLLRHLLDRFGDELDDGSTVIQIALSRAELASLVGATIETTIRIMSRWHKQGIVSTVDDGFVVHKPRRLTEILRVRRELESTSAPVSSANDGATIGP